MTGSREVRVVAVTILQRKYTQQQRWQQRTATKGHAGLHHLAPQTERTHLVNCLPGVHSKGSAARIGLGADAAMRAVAPRSSATLPTDVLQVHEEAQPYSALVDAEACSTPAEPGTELALTSSADSLGAVWRRRRRTWA